MGQKNSKKEAGAGNNDVNAPPEVNFDDFEVLRAIGRGAFGKVIIERRQIKALDITKKLFYQNYLTFILYIYVFIKVCLIEQKALNC